MCLCQHHWGKQPTKNCSELLVLTWEMLGWFRMGWMFSVTRSAQADVSTVAMIRMTKDLHLDQWTTAPWWPITAWTRSMISVLQCNKAGCDSISPHSYYDFQEGHTCLVLLQHECHKCGSASSAWMSDQWCKQLARGQTPCTPVAWQQKHNEQEGRKTNWVHLEASDSLYTVLCPFILEAIGHQL